MRAYKLSCGGKINLFLRICERRQDGYHLLESLFLPIPEPRDELTVTLLDSGSGLGAFSSNCPDLDEQNNTLIKAYQGYAQASGFLPPISLYLHKGIPSGAGLGGGSADAALLLGWLQQHNPKPLSKADLNAVAAQVGADVPFFLNPGPALVTGIGEIIEPVDLDVSNLWLVLLCPDIFVSTAQAFALWDEECGASLCGEQIAKDRFGTDQSLTECVTGDKNHRSYFHCPFRAENSLEAVVFKAWPELAGLKDKMLAQGAQAAGMSGSGSSLFGVFLDRKQAEHAAKELRKLEKARVFGPFLPGTGNFVGVSPSR